MGLGRIGFVFKFLDQGPDGKVHVFRATFRALGGTGVSIAEEPGETVHFARHVADVPESEPALLFQDLRNLAEAFAEHEMLCMLSL